MKRGYLQISFAWLFAIIVGVVIIFLAIYFSTKVTNISQYEINTKTEKSLGIILNPLETGFQTATSTSISLPSETRIYNRCDNYGNFGNQVIMVSQKSLGKWPAPNPGIAFQNKYIFSDSVIEGKKFNVFLKPFEFPFKVADLIYMSSIKKQYCFINPPEEIANELIDLKLNNEQFNLFVEDCPDSNAVVNVCFTPGQDCDIKVDYFQKTIEKESGQIYFEGDALMYAGIFSNKEVYECQVKRLMKRTKQLAFLYKEKTTLISRAGCHSNLNSDLSRLISKTNDLNDSADLYEINSLVWDIKDLNDGNWGCKLW